MIRFCPCKDETINPCPACGATVEGNDPVRGVCQALYGYRDMSWLPQLTLVDKKTGKDIFLER